MLAYRSALDSGSQSHIHTRIRILTDSMDRRCTQGRRFIGPVGAALSSLDLFTAFTVFIIIDDQLSLR